MSTNEKYRVTLRCRPEEGCAINPTSDDGSCVILYANYAASSQEALQNAFSEHARHCDQPCGNCEITAEAELVSDEVVD